MIKVADRDLAGLMKHVEDGEAPLLVARKSRRRPASRLDTRSNRRRAPRSKSLIGGWTRLSTRPPAGEMQGVRAVDAVSDMSPWRGRRAGG